MPVKAPSARLKARKFTPVRGPSGQGKPGVSHVQGRQRLRRLAGPGLAYFHNERCPVLHPVSQTAAVRRPGRVVDETIGGVSKPREAAAIGMNRPDLILAAAVGVEGNAFSV